MLRYFIAGNFWLVFGLTLLLGKGHALVVSTHYLLFGFSLIEPVVFWFAVIVSFLAAALCIFGWQRTLTRAA